MENEILVSQINAGINPAENLEKLYMRNLPFIKKVVKPYLFFDCEEDLLQECFFGLVEAVKHYETRENVKFLTYASYWLKQSCLRYIENCTKSIRIPTYFCYEITNYENAFAKLSNKLGRFPNDEEIAKVLKIDMDKLSLIKMHIDKTRSLNEKYTSEDGVEYELGDTIADSFSLENNVVDNLHDEQCKNELWGVIAKHTTEKESLILKERFKNKKTYKEIADIYNISLQCVRDIEHKTLQKLRRASVKNDLAKRFEVVMCEAYNSKLTKFKNTWESSTEITAFKLLDFDEYKSRRMREIESIM